MRVLGVDPGMAITGYGIVDEVGSGKLAAVAYGYIRTGASEPVPARLAEIYEQITKLVTVYAPDCLAVEELFFNRNVRTALGVGQARGVVLLAAARAGLPVAEYTPLHVKQAISSYGRASKQQVQRMVQMILELAEVPAPDDVADALAVAICHVQSYRWQDMVGYD